MAVDEYIERVIRAGDTGSALLAAKCAPTLRNSSHIRVIEEGMNGIAVLRLPEDNCAAVHSASGDPAQEDPVRHAASLVDRLVRQARDIGADPIGFANVIDAKTGETGLINAIADALVERANHYGIGIMNGEFAILGPQVADEANVSGTMISAIKGYNSSELEKLTAAPYVGTRSRGFKYAVFYPGKNAVYINSDGQGTKSEFNVRANTPEIGFKDTAGMKLDDGAKIGAIARVIAETVTTKGNIPFESIERYANRVMRELFGAGAVAVLHHEEAGKRICGYKNGVPAFNMSGSLVSVIDEERFKNPLKPSEGESIVAISGLPNPRSNGITDKRAIMIEMMGIDWHEKPDGKIFLQYLAQPSTILYPAFKRLIDAGLATSVYHMSGGGYNGKLARPLAKHGLYAKLDNLFAPDWREYAFMGFRNTSPEVAYAKRPMGNDGFATTRNPDTAVRTVQSMGLRARVSGKFEKLEGRTGVEIHTPSGHTIYFSGKD